jgi:hypothetical protein
MDGILLLHRKEDTTIRLLNPCTGDIEEFPPLNTLDPFLSSFTEWEVLDICRGGATGWTQWAVTHPEILKRPGLVL